MFRTVPISPDLLKIVNADTWASPDGPNASILILAGTGLLTLLGLIGTLAYRLAVTENLSNDIDQFKANLKRIVTSTFLLRLCLLQMLLVIPLIFYVNTKEHYWTSKHTTMLFMTTLALGGWLVVREFVPRFRCPYAWPIALVVLGGSLSMLCAVNIGEGMGDFFAIFGSAALTFLATQIFSTSKRLHLLGMCFSIVGVVMSLYGLAQAYLLLPIDYVYALDTRAPVSTIGNKNYAAYFLDLVIPITVALAISRRNPLQTLFTLMVYFICRWHFVLCDTRGGTISMTVGILLTTVVVAIYHGPRFRLFLYLILLEPLLWAGVNAADIHYADTQLWGRLLNTGPEKRSIGYAVSEAWKTAPEELRNALTPGHVTQWFFKGNEYLLGIPWRIPALILGILLALGIFWFLVTRIKDWTIHLGAAALLAFLPYWFVVWGTMPSNLYSTNGVAKVAEGVRLSDIPYRDLASQVMEQYSGGVLQAAVPYNQMILSKHRVVAAMFSFSLFVCMAVFLLFRWFDREEGWFPGFIITGSIGIWLMVFFLLGAEGNPIRHLFSTLISPLSHAWPIELRHITAHHASLGFLLSAFVFSSISLLSLIVMIGAMQLVPAQFTREEVERLTVKAWVVGKWALGVITVLLILGVWFHPRIVRVRSEMYRTLDQGLVRALFFGAHAYFNTQGQVKGEEMDGPIGFRLEIYQGTLRKMRDNPILGVGPGNFKVVNPHPRYETALERRILGKEVLGRHPHNDFLEDATDSGGIALLGMIWVFGTAGLILFRSLRFIHPPRNSTDVFMNTFTWGLLWAMTAILIHAQFEMPLLQPSSTYPAWMLLGVCYQLWRIQRRRALAVSLESPLLLTSNNPSVVAERILKGESLRSAAVYELPPVRPSQVPVISRFPLSISWSVMLVVVTLLMGSILIRQFVGEMWLRWGMIFSESGVERYDYVFTCMKKSQDLYPLEMETNYILGRYCIDATSKVFRPWVVRNRPDVYDEKERQGNEKAISDIRRSYQLDVDKLIDYANLGVDVHKRDIFMNPNYKWAHNNMGVLYDKLSQIYEVLAETNPDPGKKAEYLQLSHENELNSRNCYSIALEIDDLQVYALYNLGHGALRDQKVSLAQQYFERTLLADPNRRDVNFFIGKCRLAQRDFAGGIDAMSELLTWASGRGSSDLDSYQKQEAETLLYEVGRYTVTDGDPHSAYRAADLLAKYYNRCKYLPLLAHAAVNTNKPEEGLKLTHETLTTCGNKISSEVVFAQAKAYCLLKDATGAMSSLQTLLRSNAGDVFRDEIRDDTAFELVRNLPAYQSLLKAIEKTKAAPAPIAPATPVNPPVPVPAVNDPPQSAT